MKSPPKGKRRLCRTTLKTSKAKGTYHFSLFLQVFGGRRQAIRRCVACGVPVRNKNLGGHDGRSALTGRLWCNDCADWPKQLVLRLRV
jgi:hypothetical protein